MTYDCSICGWRKKHRPGERRASCITPSLPDSSYLPDLIKDGLLRSIPVRSLPASDDIDPPIVSRLSSADPKHQYTVPYFWVRNGIVMDRKRVEQALGGPAARSWSLLLDPRQLAKLSSCGATLLDARQKFFAIWMNWHGALAERPSAREQRAFLQALIDLRPHVRAVDNLEPTKRAQAAATSSLWLSTLSTLMPFPESIARRLCQPVSSP